MANDFNPIYDALITKITGALPSSVRLADPIDIERNDDFSLDRGVAITTGSFERESPEGGAVLNNVLFEMLVTFTRGCPGAEDDASLWDSITKDLHADRDTVSQALEQDRNLGINSELTEIDLESGAQVQKIRANDTEFLALPCVYRLRLIEFHKK